MKRIIFTTSFVFAGLVFGIVLLVGPATVIGDTTSAPVRSLGQLSSAQVENIFYSQRAVSADVWGLVDSMKSPCGYNPDFPIDVVEMDVYVPEGEVRLLTMDHRRLVAAKKAGLREVPINLHQAGDGWAPTSPNEAGFWKGAAQRATENYYGIKGSYGVEPPFELTSDGLPRTWGDAIRIRALDNFDPEWGGVNSRTGEVVGSKDIHIPPRPKPGTICGDCSSDVAKLDRMEQLLKNDLKDIKRFNKLSPSEHADLQNSLSEADAEMEKWAKEISEAQAKKELDALRKIEKSAEIAHGQALAGKTDSAIRTAQSAERALAQSENIAPCPEEGVVKPPPPPKPPPKPCPPGTTFQGYHTIPENINDIIKLYRGMSYDDVLADIDHFLKTGRPGVAGRIADAMQQSIDDELAAARPSGTSVTNPNWDVQLGRYGAKEAELKPASDELGKLRGKIKAAKPPVCPTEAELAARAGDSFKKAEGTLKNILRKLKPTEVKEGIQKIKDFLKKGSWKGIRAQLVSKGNVAFTVIASGIEVYIQARQIDELLYEVEKIHANFDRSIRTIKQAKAELERVRMSPQCTVKDPKDPKNLNKLRFAIISEIKNAYVLAVMLDAANARLMALHDEAWLGKDWLSILRGFGYGFGSKTDFTGAVVDLYPELTGEDCEEECAPLSLIPICLRGGGGGGGGAGGGGGSGWDISGADVCNFPIMAYTDRGEERYEPMGSRSGFAGQCIGAVQCCAMADCAPGPYANVWGLRLRNGRVVRIWGCQGLPRELPEGACRQPDFTALEMNALCNESEQEWPPALRARVAALEQAANMALTGSAGAPPTPPAQKPGTTRSGNTPSFQFSAFSVTNFAARLVVAGLLAGR